MDGGTTYNVNDNLNISFMKCEAFTNTLKNFFMKVSNKTFFVLLSFVALFATTGANAQFRSLPGVVTDSFKIRYPDAKDVAWADKVSAFQATFMLDGDRVVARYSKDGQWQGATKAILKDKIPAAVKDGL